MLAGAGVLCVHVYACEGGVCVLCLSARECADLLDAIGAAVGSKAHLNHVHNTCTSSESDKYMR